MRRKSTSAAFLSVHSAEAVPAWRAGTLGRPTASQQLQFHRCRRGGLLSHASSVACTAILMLESARHRVCVHFSRLQIYFYNNRRLHIPASHRQTARRSVSSHTCDGANLTPGPHLSLDHRVDPPPPRPPTHFCQTATVPQTCSQMHEWRMCSGGWHRPPL